MKRKCGMIFGVIVIALLMISSATAITMKRSNEISKSGDAVESCDSRVDPDVKTTSEELQTLIDGLKYIDDPNITVLGDFDYFGLLIGKIKDLHRFRNKDYISCQAVRVHYNGSVLIRPPNVIDYIEGWLFSGEIKIIRPYIGILTRNFICAYVCADSDVFHYNGIPML